MSHGPGTIGVGCGELARFTAFTVSLAATVQPEGTQLSVFTSASIVDNNNGVCRSMRPDDEWLWLLGDDHAWDPSLLIGLLDVMADSGAGVVVPLVCRRNPPWDLVTYKAEVVRDGDDRPWWEPFQWGELPETGWFEIAAAGNAGMLIRRDVLDELGDPWFCGSDGVTLNEDVLFCKRARELGHRIVASADHVMGHIGIHRIWPHRKDGRWGTLTDWSVAGGNAPLFLPGGPREYARGS